MPTVAELDILIDATDRATDDLARIGALIESMGSKDFDIVVKAMIADALRDLGKVEVAKVKAATGVVIDVVANTAKAEAQIDELTDIDRELNLIVNAATENAQRKIDELHEDADNRIIEMKVDVDEANFRGAMREINAELERFDDKTVSANAELNIAGAMSLLGLVNGAIDDLDGKVAKVKVDVDTASLRGLIREMQQLGSHAVTASRNVRGMTAAVIGLAPALVPIGAVGVAGLAAFSGAAVSAGAGLGLFGVIAKTVYGKVNDAVTQITQGEQQLKEAMTDPAKAAAILKIETAYNALTPAQAGAVRAQIAFGKAWADFAAQYEPAIFEMIRVGFEGILSLLPNLKPIMDGATAALADLEKRAISALHNPVWQSFFDYLGRTARPAITGMGVAAGNLATGFAGLLMAFEPLTTAFISGMISMSQKFAAWATTLSTNRGFQDFIAYVKANTPVVLAIVGQLGALFLNLVQALMPIGAVALPIILNFLRAVNTFADAHPKIMVVVVAFGALIAAVIALAGPIAAIWSAVTLLAGPFLYLAGLIPGVSTALAAVGSAFMAIIPWVLRFAGVIGAAIAVGILIIQNWDLVVAAGRRIMDAVRFIVTEFQTGFPIIGAVVKTVMTTIVSTIGMAIGQMLSSITGGMGSMTMSFSNGFGQAGGSAKAGMMAVVNSVINGMVQVVASVYSGMSSAVASFLSGFASARTAVAGAMAAIASAVVAGMSRLVAAIVSGVASAVAALNNGFNQARAAVTAAMGAIASAVVAGMSRLVSAVASGVASAVAALNNGFNQARAAVTAAMGAIVAAISAGMAQVVAAGAAGVARFVAAVSAGAGQAAAAAGRYAGAMVGAFRSLPAMMYNAAIAGVRGFVNGILAGIAAVANAARRLAHAAASALPGSPAETGPLSGKGYTLYRGQRLGEDLAAGIASRAAMVAASTNKYAGLIASGLTAGDARMSTVARGIGGTLSTGGSPSSAPNGSGASFTFNINNPIAEVTSVTTNKALQKVAALGLV